MYAPLGPTHQAIEDLAILRAIPNMTIVVPADANEMRRLMPLTVDHKGPLIVTPDDKGFQIGKVIPVRERSDVLIVTTGITLKVALDTAGRLAGQGFEAAVLHVSTIKPLDAAAILPYAARVPVIVTIEEHTVVGGLGSVVAEVLGEANLDSPKRFKRIGIPDAFPDQYGSQASLMERYSLTTEHLLSVIPRLAEETFPITAQNVM